MAQDLVAAWEQTVVNNVETVQSMYEAFGQGDVPAILERLADDVAWQKDAQDHGVPWLKPGTGHDHALAFFASLQALDFQRFEPRLIIGDGPTVIAVIHATATMRSTGLSIDDANEVHIWTFNDGGKVAAFNLVVDTHQRVKAARLA